MLVPQLALVLVLLVVCCFAPGFYFVRRLRWSPLEKLCGAIGLSLILLYLAAWAIYCAGLRGALPLALVSVVCAGMGVAAWRDIAGLVRVTAVRRALAGYGFLLLWTMVLLAIIRVYSGAGWFSDWLEHFQRSLFFLHHFPADTPIFPQYVLPARPPVMNVLAAFFLGQTQDRFELFQVIFAFLNLLAFLPCYLLMPALVTRAGRPQKPMFRPTRRTLLLAGLFALSPAIMENGTYPWTKEGAVFYVVLALWFYLAGWRKNDRLRTTAAFVALAAGLLVHYSAGPYLVFLAAHYMLVMFPKRRAKWRELGGIAVACGLLLATWFGWSMAVYGVKGTLASNSSVTSSQEYKGGTLSKIALNFYDTVVPNLLRNPEELKMFEQASSAGALRDKAFVFYQLNLIGNLGLVGGPMVLWLLWRAFWRRKAKAEPEVERTKNKTGRPEGRTRAAAPAPAKRREQRFWLAMTACCLILGIAVVGERDTIGVAQLIYLPLVACGLTLLAAAVPWRNRAVAFLLIGGCVVDFGLGVFLQVRIESEDNTRNEGVFADLIFRPGTSQNELPAGSLSSSATTNWYMKHFYELNRRLLTELPRRYAGDAGFQRLWPTAEAHIRDAQSQDRLFWYGWYARNGGVMEYFGDHFAGADGTGTNVATGVLLALFLGLTGALLRQAASAAAGAG